MNNCALCQQLNNYLINIYNNRIKSLAQNILKLKGYKNALDNKKPLTICEKCEQGIENVATFWKSVPEAEQDLAIENVNKVQVVEDQNNAAVFKTLMDNDEKLKLPPITLLSQEQCTPAVLTEKTLHEPIKLRIKLPPKRKRHQKPITTNNIDSDSTNIIKESPSKRIRRPPKRYEDFKTKSLSKHNNTLEITNTSKETSLENFPEMASLRLANGDNVGKLVEVENSAVSSKMRIICQFCCKVFHFEKKFKNHLNEHNPQQLSKSPNKVLQSYLFYCKLCDKAFREHYAVRRHYRFAHSEERTLKCEHCEASFKYKCNLDYHMAKHIPKKCFECVFCKKTFVLRYELKIHLRTHTNEKPYKCQFCSYAFAHQTNLKNHQKVKHFKDATNQSAPKDTHTNEVNVTCVETTKENLLESNLGEEIEKQAVILDQNVAGVISSTNFDGFESGLKDIDREIFSAESQELEDDIATDLTNNNSYKTFEISKSKDESYESIDLIEQRFKNLPKNATVHINNSILKALASSELLELKKLPKCYQNTALINQNCVAAPLDETRTSQTLEIMNSNSYEEEKLKENNSENYVYEFLNDTANDRLTQSLELEKTAQIKTLIKYKTSPANDYNNSAINSIPITSKKLSSKNLHSSQSIKNSVTPTTASLLKMNIDHSENTKLINFQVPTGCALTKGGKFINISKLSDANSSLLNFNTIGDLKEIKIINKSLETCKETGNMSSHNENQLKVSTTFKSEAQITSQSWNIIKVSSKPVKIQNFRNLNKLPDKNETLNSTKTNSTMSSKNYTLKTTLNKTPDKIISKSKVSNDLTTLQYEVIESEHLSDLQPPFILLKTPLKSTNNSAQSLLKPVSKAQQISTLSIVNTSKNLKLLSAKPLITKIEILPSINTVCTLLKSTSNPSPANLIKLPANYKYQCPHCWKYFKRKSPLTKHLRTHTGEKPYICNLCPKSYADASNYKKHKILHKNAADVLNISRINANAVHNSPTYSTVSDPDPDGIEVMQTIQKFESSSTEDDEASSAMESYMWQNALEHALNNDEIVENIKKNLAGINKAIMPKSMQQLASKTQSNIRNINKNFSSEDPD